MNDWYVRHPDLKPAKIFNIHKSEYAGGELLNSAKRFTGDWKEEYRKSGAKIVCLEPIDGLDSTYIDIKLLEETFPLGSLSASMSIMVGMGYLQGFTHIHLTGCRLMGGGYVYEIPGLLAMIKFVREHGVHFTTDYESDWKRDLTNIDWSTIKAKTTYWEQMEIGAEVGSIKLSLQEMQSRCTI